MKKIYFKILVIILIIIGSFSVSFANEDEDADYNETKKMHRFIYRQSVREK